MTPGLHLVRPNATLTPHGTAALLDCEIQGRLQHRAVRYWRSKHGAEVDFVLPRRAGGPVAIECKWKAAAFDPAGLLAFRRLHPNGDSFLVASDITRSHTREHAGIPVQLVSLEDLVTRLSTEPLQAG